MRLSSESSRQRWSILAIVWAVAVTLVGLHALAVGKYLEVSKHVGLRGAPQASTPLQRSYLSFESDAQTWIQHAIGLTEGHDLRLRYTLLDNPPEGREVHWNSAWAWAIAAAGHLRRSFTDEPLPLAIERAAFWLNPAVLLGLIVFFSAWAARRWGVIAGVVVAAGMIGHSQFYEGFFPGYTDHHGLLTTAVFGGMLGALAMGGGWWRADHDDSHALLPASPGAVRQGAILSAVCGATGLWVSAASVIPGIAIVGLTALAIVWRRGRALQTGGATFDAGAWRLWGRVGAALSVFFYLLEYAPSHLGLRLEVNHPLYAFAWLGGAELIAQGAERWLAAPGARWLHPRRLIWPALAIAAVPLTIAIGGTAVFVLRDPFLAKLPHFVLEGMNLLERIPHAGWRELLLFFQLGNLPLAVAAVLLWRRRNSECTVLWFAFLATLLLTAMGWWQTRWLLNASGPQVCLSLVLLAELSAGRRPGIRWLIAALAIGVLYLPSAVRQITGTWSMAAARHLTAEDALQALFRDVAAGLRASQPKGDIVLLSSPNSSTGIGYYGRFKTVGTLYWENLPGLKAAGNIFSARTDDEAATLIRARGVTHIAMISQEHFLAEYYSLLHPNEGLDAVKKTFGYRLLFEKKIPLWLEVIPYQMPPDLRALNISVLLFKVAFDQKIPEALYHLALGKVALGDTAAAEKDFDTVAQLAPNAPEPWLRKAELLVARKAWDAALDAFFNGIKRAPRTEWPRLCNAAAAAFYTAGGVAPTIRMYRESLGLAFDPAIASNLAWLRATSTEPVLRNGDEALDLAQRAVQTDPNSAVFLGSLAAALAEKGRYAEAVEAGTKSLAAAQAAGDKARIPRLEETLASYRAGRPWRE